MYDDIVNLSNMELIFTDSGQFLAVHPRSRCAGQICCIHNPTDHHMRMWPQTYRGDRGITERTCGHSIGHPDPDDVRIRTGTDPGIHGCDGCCRGPVAANTKGAGVDA